MSADNGQFVWYDLMTTDTEGAKAFYSAITGWTTRKWSDEYETWLAGERPIGGLMTLPEEARRAGAPTHWLAYVAVDDVDATLKKAEALGAKVFVPTKDVPNVGRFAILADPQGAIFALFTPAQAGSMPVDDETPGHFNWAELNTTDWQSAWKFYTALFGWTKTRSMDMGPELGEYFMFSKGSEKSLGGMSNVATMMQAPAHWLHYVQVRDTDEAVKLIADKGGKVLNGPMEVPGGQRIAQCMDPQGGFFAIVSSPK